MRQNLFFNLKDCVNEGGYALNVTNWTSSPNCNFGLHYLIINHCHLSTVPTNRNKVGN